MAAFNVEDAKSLTVLECDGCEDISVVQTQKLTPTSVVSLLEWRRIHKDGVALDYCPRCRAKQ